MGIKFANSAFATLAAGINSSVTSITLTTGQGARFPSLAGGDYFFATLIDTSNNLEIVKCTARATDVLTVVRGQESTTARAFSTGDRIELRITAQGLVDSSNIDLVLPSQTSNSGKYLTTNGTASSWGTVSPAVVSDQGNSSTGYFDVPSGTTAQRPGSPAAGMIRDNTSLGYPEIYDTTLAAWKALGGILFTHHFEDATRNISLSPSADGTALTFDFNKRYAGTHLVVRGASPVSGQYSYQSGEFMQIGSTRKYEAAHFTSPPDSMSDDGIYGTCLWNGIWTDQNTTGTKTVRLGWAATSGSSGEKPGNIWNPDSRGPRARARTTVITIYEVDPAALASIT